MEYEFLLKRSEKEHQKYLSEWSRHEVQVVNNDPKTFDDLWNAHKEVGVFGQIFFSISRVETIINEIIRSYYKFREEPELTFFQSRKWKKYEERSYNRFFGANIDLKDKIDILREIGKYQKINNYENIVSYLDDYPKLRNVIAHAELTYCNTRHKRLLIYRKRGADHTYHVDFQDYVETLKANLEIIFPMLVEWFEISSKKADLTNHKYNSPPRQK